MRSDDDDDPFFKNKSDYYAMLHLEQMAHSRCSNAASNQFVYVSIKTPKQWGNIVMVLLQMTDLLPHPLTRTESARFFHVASQPRFDRLSLWFDVQRERRLSRRSRLALGCRSESKKKIYLNKTLYHVGMSVSHPIIFFKFIYLFLLDTHYAILNTEAKLELKIGPLYEDSGDRRTAYDTHLYFQLILQTLADTRQKRI